MNRHSLRRSNSRNPYLHTTDRAHVGSRLATATPNPNDHRLQMAASSTSVDLSLEDVSASASAANGSNSAAGLRNLFATLRSPSRSGAKNTGSQQEIEMNDMHNGAGLAHPNGPHRSYSTTAPWLKGRQPIRRQTSTSPSGVAVGGPGPSSEVPDIISSTLASELSVSSRAGGGTTCASTVDSDLATSSAASPTGSPEYSTSSLRRVHNPRQHNNNHNNNMYSSAHASIRHSSQLGVNDELPNTSNSHIPKSSASTSDPSQALYNRLYRIRKLSVITVLYNWNSIDFIITAQ